MKHVLVFVFAIAIIVGTKEKIIGSKPDYNENKLITSMVTPSPKVFTFEVSGISVSAYNATKKQCGKADGITASGVMVHDGVIACNFLPFGTKVMIPGMFGKKIFTVYDRMATKNNNNVDIYTKSLWRALKIGRSDQTIVVIN